MLKKLLLVLALVAWAVPASAQYFNNVQLTINSTSGGVSFTSTDILLGSGHPQVMSAACVSNTTSTADFRYRVDGGAPTTSVGNLVPAGGAILFTDTNALLNFKAIRTGSVSAVLSCTFSDAQPPPVYPVGAGGGGGSSTLTCVGDTTTPCAVRGVVTNNNQGSPTAGNLPVVPARANAAAQSWTEGNLVHLSVDLAGNQRTIGSLGDNVATAGSNRVATLPAVAETSPATRVNGRDSALSMTTTGFLRVGGIFANNGVEAATDRVGTLPGVNENAAPSRTDGRNGALSFTLGGAARVMITNAAGAASTIATDQTFGTSTYTEATTTGPLVGSVRNDTLDALANITNEVIPLTTNEVGALWTAKRDPCSWKAKSYYVVNLTAAATVEIANAVAGEFWYICSVNLVAGGANAVLIAHDDTDGCGSLTAGMNGGTTAATGWGFAANGGIALGNGDSAVMKSATANHYLCIAPSTTAQLSGTIAYVSAP